MDFLKDEAIVLRKSYTGDYDLSITVYMRKYGKENIYIPKGQHLKSPFLHSTEPFTWLKGVFIKRKEKIFIKEIDKSKNLGLSISRDFDRFITGSKLLELFNKYVIFPDEKIFIFLKKSVYYLTQDINLTNFKLNFISKLIFLSGIYPQLDNCVKCGSKINRWNFQNLSINEGGVICKKCSRQRQNISYQDVKDLKTLKNISFKNLNKLKISSPEKLERFMLDYLSKNF